MLTGVHNREEKRVSNGQYCMYSTACRVRVLKVTHLEFKLRPMKDESVSFERHSWGCGFEASQSEHCSERKLQDSMAWTGLRAAYLSKKSKAVLCQPLGVNSSTGPQSLSHVRVTLLSAHILYMLHCPLDTLFSSLLCTLGANYEENSKSLQHHVTSKRG